MDGTSLTIILILIGIIIVCSFFSIKFFIKYKKTRKIRYLLLSIVLGFVALTLFLLLLSALARSVTVVYGPPPIPDHNIPLADNITPPNVVYGPPPSPPNIVYGPPPR